MCGLCLVGLRTRGFIWRSTGGSQQFFVRAAGDWGLGSGVPACRRAGGGSSSETEEGGGWCASRARQLRNYFWGGGAIGAALSEWWAGDGAGGGGRASVNGVSPQSAVSTLGRALVRG